MRPQSVHLKILVFLFAVAGLVLTAYQIFILNIPITEHETDHLWNIDAKVEFKATNGVPVKLQMFVPPQNTRFVTLNESFISKNFGVSVNKADDNRLITWSSRRASGSQTLFYRLVVTSRFGAEMPDTEGPVYRDPIEVEGAEKIAIEALLAPIRQYSADIETFIGEAIKRINDNSNDNVKVLLNGDDSTANKVDVLETLLAAAHVPIERINTLNLAQSSLSKTELWIRSYNGDNWLYFNPITGQKGLPKDRLIWWYGDKPLMELEGGSRPTVEFTVSRSEMNAIRLAQLVRDANSATRFLDNSLYGLPLSDQQTYQLIIMIPVGVLIILLLRNVVGIQTLGTFTPVLIALAFRETGLGFGVALFTVITALGLTVRSYLEYLKLQMLPRLSVVLTFVVMLMAAISLFSHKVGLESALSVSLFPMVILTMTIERLSITWDERGGNTAFKEGVTTLAAAALAHYVMSLPQLRYFVFTFPGVLLVMVALMLALGRYRGYRITELFRFKELLKD